MTERRVLRGVFTREVNKLEELLALADCDHVEIRSRYASLVERYDKLKRIDDEVYQELLQKEDLEDIALETEIDNCSEYDLKYFKVREKVQTLQVAEPAVSEVNSIGTHPSNQRVLRLPKLELKRFDGNVKDWIGFWAQFNKLHEDICLKDEDKFVYLIQCMETNSPAQKLVENFPPSKENYKKAIELLKSRYGKEELLIEYYVRELLSLVLKKDSLRSISQLYDSLEGQLRALDSLGVTKEKYAAMLFPLVESALPEVMFKTWDRYRVAKQTSTKEPDCCLTKLLAFLKTEVEGEERLKLRQSSFEANKKVDRVNQGEKSKTKKWEVPSAATLVSTEDVSVNKGNKVNKEIVCVFCSRNTHPSQECAVAIDCSLDERQGTVKKKGACFRCLRQGHVSAKCKVFVKCPFCKGKHYALMCTKTGSNEPKSDLISKTVNMIAGSNEGHVTYLQTLVARVVIGGCTHRVRVLCDSGSQRSYIKKSCAKKLELKQTGKVTLSQELFGGRKTAPVCFDSYQLTLTSMNQKNRCEVTVLGSDSICNGAPLVEAGLYSFLRDKGVELTDFVHNDCITSDIQVLLGADVWSQIITPDFVHINESLVAVRTCLGWTVMGSSETTSSTTSAQTLLTLTQSTRVADLWEIEFMGIKDPGEQIRGEERQQQVKNFFDKTVKREEASGRYIVKLPWIDGCTSLETNREVTLKRLLNTSRRLRRMQKFQDYDEVFQEWVNQGIIEGVEDKDSDAPTHYLPHRAVLKDSGTTKIRPVFDASNKDRNGNSLNDCLEPGPNLIDLVPVVLTNFRSYPIGLIADIEKAFLQIIIDPEDRDMLRFLWWDNGKVITARHCRVVFGVCSSPFLLVSVMNHLLDGAPTHLKEVAAKMKLAFYVDNCLTGVVSKEEIEPFILKAQELMLSAGFNLRGWVNSLDCGVGTTENVLGLRWYCDVDELGCNFSPTVGLVTRRMVLSSTQRIFDPIGFSAPVTLVPKLILQKTWQRKIGWDEVLPEDICDEFCRWTRQLQYLQDCRIPRRIFLNDTSTLHVFVDASKRAFGCCIFLRTEDENKIKLSLLMAKSRVAPLKELTLPRLELMGALLGVRMSRLSLRCLHRDYIPTVFWSDSAVALAWIAKGGHWSVFVENRVKEIQEYSKGSSWRHLPGSLNPADLLSRGCSPKQLWKSRWWEGPVWLKRDEEECVSDSPVPVLEEVNRERRKTVVAAQNTVVETILLHLSSRFSGYLKIVRTIAWIRRFRKGKQRDRGHTEIGSEEFIDAEKKPFFLIQRETLRGEERKEQLKNLQVFTDDEGILRMKSRVVDAEDIPEYTYPVVLPSRHVMVERMIQQYHHFHNHAGTHTLLILLRQRVWILQGRRAVAAVVRKCVICRRYSAKVLKVPFPPLPRDRTQTSSTFQITGTDLAGPVFLRGGEKGWIVIFTCAVYRAVHLELITSLSTVAYVQALRRFVARRGRVNSIYSDNGTNFTGLRKALEQLDWSEIEKTCSLLKIKWNLNPPTAAWWGGFWERLIRILKELLRRNLGKACLNYEEMCTLLCDCENLMNNRPLTYVSEEDELKPLRPSMFLQSLEGNDVHDLDQIQSISLNDRWRYLQAVRESLRNRFKQKYLGFLRSRSQKQQGSIRVGDIVLVGSDNKKRINWPLGRVVELLPGRDNVTRLVRLRTATGILLRPVQRLYYLEMNCVEKEDPDTSSRHRRCEETLREEVLSSDSESGKEGELKTRCGRTVRQLKRLDL